MTKKRLLVITGIASIFLVAFNFIGTFNLCGGREYSVCMDVVFNIFMILFPIIPLFLFSLITYKMQDNVFQAWWRFARIWIPISMLAILVSPSNTHNWMFPIEKGTVAFFSAVLFAVISLILIITWQFKEKKR
ncbi:MAG: hypothetical protein GX765_05340 [Candidatus Moranbacteria bacterium]|jgi:hypothetical protein|nr:hypothetical protein [Candidatus Moranbacteria bacterium]